MIITSLEGGPVDIEHWFRERAQVEERLKDSKLGMALRHLPSGHKVVNAVWMWSAFLALNISSVLSAFARAQQPDDDDSLEGGADSDPDRDRLAARLSDSEQDPEDPATRRSRKHRDGSDGFRTPVPIVSGHLFRGFRTPQGSASGVGGHPNRPRGSGAAGVRWGSPAACLELSVTTLEEAAGGPAPHCHAKDP